MLRKRRSKTAIIESPITTLDFKPMEGGGGGFTHPWLDGESTDGTLGGGLSSGAGLNNPLLTLWIRKDGVTKHFTADMRDVLKNLLEQAQT